MMNIICRSVILRSPLNISFKLSDIFKLSFLDSTRSRLRDFFVKTVVEKLHSLVVVFEELLPSELCRILDTVDRGTGGWHWDQGVVRLFSLLVLHRYVLLNIR